MASYRNNSSSASSNGKCESCPQYSRPASGTLNTFDPAAVYVETLKSCLSDIERLENRVRTLEQNDAKREDYFKEAASLAQTSRFAVIALMSVPVLQLLACAVVVYYLGLEEKLPSILNWFIGGVGLFSVIDMIITIIKANSDKQKLDRIEKDIENLKKPD